MFSPVPSPEGTKETYWETKAPSSDVLGIGAGVSSGNFAAASVFAALVGGYCTGQVIISLDLSLPPPPYYLPYPSFKLGDMISAAEPPDKQHRKGRHEEKITPIQGRQKQAACFRVCSILEARGA